MSVLTRPLYRSGLPYRPGRRTAEGQTLVLCFFSLLSRVASCTDAAASGRTRIKESPSLRTLIISDAHGYPQLIENALKHARFRPGLDRLIYAGDLVDRGPDPEGCLALVDRYATQVLVGNHDLAVLAGFEIFEQVPESLWLQHEFLDRVLMPDPSRWRAVAVVDDVLVSHGGISARYETLLRQCSGDLARLAAHLKPQLPRCRPSRGHHGRLGGRWHPGRERSSLVPTEGRRPGIASRCQTGGGAQPPRAELGRPRLLHDRPRGVLRPGRPSTLPVRRHRPGAGPGRRGSVGATGSRHGALTLTRLTRGDTAPPFVRHRPAA